jgi:hypothetical protein
MMRRPPPGPRFEVHGPRSLELGTRVRDLAITVNVAERHVSRQLRSAYLAPEVLKRLVYKREVTAVTLMAITECAALPWGDQAEVVFDGAEQGGL